MHSRRALVRQRSATTLALDLQRLVPRIDAPTAAKTALRALRLPHEAEHQLRVLGLAARIRNGRERRAGYSFDELERALLAVTGTKPKARARLSAAALRRGPSAGATPKAGQGLDRPTGRAAPRARRPARRKGSGR